MKLLYATSIVWPSPLANRKQIIRTSRALWGLMGEELLLGVHAASEKLPCPHRVLGGSPRSAILGLRYALLVRREQFTHVYCREEKLFFMLRIYSFLLGGKAKFFFEAHGVSRALLFRLAVRLADGIVAISHGIVSDLEKIGVPVARCTVVPDAVDAERFAGLMSKQEARRELGLSPSGVLVAYIGSFGLYHSWKGIDVLLEAVPFADTSWTFLLVGGRKEEVEELKRLHPTENVLLWEHQDSDTVTKVHVAADVLVIPNKGGNPTSERYTSPIKLFSYMAATRPVLASDLPSIREIVSEREVFFFEPDNPRSLASVLHTILSSPEEALARAERARELVLARYTWDKRASAILAFLKK